tara:strand:+ start:1055 stop:1531 length:477 start_codon:yes stop_codon:yes gene_type:complete
MINANKKLIENYEQKIKDMIGLRIIILTVFCAIAPLQSQEATDSTIVEKSPKKAVLHSLIPGGGQLYNGKYVKAVILFGAEVFVIYKFIENRDIYNKWTEDEYSLSHERYRQKRNKYAWWIGFVYIYGLLDALVDSHLSTFEENGVTDSLTVEKGENP